MKTTEDLQKGKKQADQKLDVLESEPKHLELRDDLLDARMKVYESKIRFTRQELERQPAGNVVLYCFFYTLMYTQS